MVSQSRYPEHFGIEASGDFVGRASGHIEQDGAYVNATLRLAHPRREAAAEGARAVMRPLLAANHRWAMRQGEESLALELLRRRAATPDAAREHSTAARADDLRSRRPSSLGRPRSRGMAT